MNHLKRIAQMLVYALALVAGAAAHAQTEAFPTKPIKLIVPIGPGTSSDATTRFIAEKFQDVFGVAGFVENKPGGEFQIALQALLSAPADGHTLMMISSSSMVVNPLTVKNWPFDVQQEIRPLAQATRTATVFVTRGNSPIKSLAELVAAAKADPGGVSMGNYSAYYRSGVATFARMANVKFNDIYYKGQAFVVGDLIGGQIDAAIMDVVAADPLIKAGKLRALAVTSADRIAYMPAVPTVRELGFPDYEFSIWIGYGISAKTPPVVAAKLEAGLLRILKSDEFRAFTEKNGNTTIIAGNGADLAKQIAQETERFKANLTP